MSRRQCSKCPWKIGQDPREIPGVYREDKHLALSSTIAPRGEFRAGTLRLMTCHETAIGKELPCVGWLYNQLGVGNNIGLRLAVIQGHVDAEIEVIGPQRARFEDTLPRPNKVMKMKTSPSRRER